jgi:hypothetical protein
MTPLFSIGQELKNSDNSIMKQYLLKTRHVADLS